MTHQPDRQTRRAYPIAVEMLTAERERLARDHYDNGIDTSDDGRVTPCDGCSRAYAVRLELEALRP